MLDECMGAETDDLSAIAKYYPSGAVSALPEAPQVLRHRIGVAVEALLGSDVAHPVESGGAPLPTGGRSP